MKRFNDYDELEKNFYKDIDHLCYYMKGSLSREDAWLMTRAERASCSEFIKEQLKEEIELMSKFSMWGLR